MDIQEQRNRKIQTYCEREVEIYRYIGREKEKDIDIQGERSRKIQTYREREVEIYRYIGREKL